MFSLRLVTHDCLSSQCVISALQRIYTLQEGWGNASICSSCSWAVVLQEARLALRYSFPPEYTHLVFVFPQLSMQCNHTVNIDDVHTASLIVGQCFAVFMLLVSSNHEQRTRLMLCPWLSIIMYAKLSYSKILQNLASCIAVTRWLQATIPSSVSTIYCSESCQQKARPS